MVGVWAGLQVLRGVALAMKLGDGWVWEFEVLGSWCGCGELEMLFVWRRVRSLVFTFCITHVSSLFDVSDLKVFCRCPH